MYYEIKGGKKDLITGTSSTGDSMRLEYIRYPRRIFYDSTNSTEQTGPTYTYTAGSGCVNCELSEQQRQEIVDIAVREYLERIKDPRYKSFLQEEAIKSQSK